MALSQSELELEPLSSLLDEDGKEELVLSEDRVLLTESDESSSANAMAAPVITTGFIPSSDDVDFLLGFSGYSTPINLKATAIATIAATAINPLIHSGLSSL